MSPMSNSPVRRGPNTTTTPTGGAFIREGQYWYDTDVTKKRQNVDKLAAQLAIDERFKNLWVSPKTLRFIAEWYYDHSETYPNHTIVAQAAKYFKEPGPYRTSGGGGADKAAQLRTLQTAVLNESMRLGLKLTPEEIDYMSRVAFDLKYSAAQLTNDLVSLAEVRQVGDGSIATTTSGLETLAKNYLVTLAPDVFKDWSLRIAKGQATEDSFQTFVINQAKIAFPWLSSFLDQGLSTNEIFQNSRAQIASGLEIDPTTIDFSKPDFLSLAVVTDEKGNTRLASNSELRANIRQDPRWESTSSARQLSATLARSIAQIFGRSAF